MKKGLFVVLVIPTLVLSLVTCATSGTVETKFCDESGDDNTGVSQQLLSSISWSVLSKQEESCSIVFPQINQNDLVKDQETVQRINDAIQGFLLDYMNSFVEGTLFFMQSQVKRLDGSVLSILYEGEAWTPSRAIGQAFALNFDLVQGEMLSLEDIINESEVIERIKNGSARLTVERKREHLGVPPYVSFEISRVIHNDIEHTHDFFLSKDFIYVIVDRSPTSNYYSIYQMEFSDT